jgi:hypothetical protein
VQALEEIQPVPFGGFLLLERLAMGGMAEVFLARSTTDDRLCAVKRILPNVAADDEFIAMFIDEAKIAGQLSHANIAKIVEIGKVDGSYFIAMEYISGHDVRALWDRTRDAGGPTRGLPIGIACSIVKKLAEGLDYAHRRKDARGRPLGIIHRDVSPQNLLLSYEGDLKIIDFGIAKAANRLVRTQTGILKGKFAYMAPEQARGEPIDHRSDVFAIGVVLYELLTGERAFKGETDFALLEKVRRVDVVPVRQLRPEVPRELERIVMKAMGRDAGDRYEWASVLADELDRFLTSNGITTSREELGAFVRRTFREEHQEEQRRLALLQRKPAVERRVDGSGATVVRGGPQARNGRPPPVDEVDADDDESSLDSTAVGDPVTEAIPALRREDDTAVADDDKASAVERSADRAQRPGARDARRADARGEARADGRGEPRADTRGERKEPAEGRTDSRRQRPPRTSGEGRAAPRGDLAALRDQAARIARGEATRPTSAATPALSPRTPGPAAAAGLAAPPRSSPSGGIPRDGGVTAPELQALPPASSLAWTAPPHGPAPDAPSLRPRPPASTTAPPPLEPTQLPQPAPAPSSNAAVIAGFVGALVGAGLAFGVALLMRAPPPDTLLVTTPRQVEVRRGDVVLCAQTPCAVHLGKGSHTLRLKAPGVAPVDRVVDVGAGAAIVDVALEQPARTLRIESNPPGALVLIDDKPVPEPTPVTLSPQPVGKTLRLRLLHDGFEPLTTTREVTEDAIWRFDLPPPTTTWKVSATPADALVAAGPREGEGRLELAVGRKPVSLRVARPGCETQQHTLTANGTASGELRVELACRTADGHVSIQTAARPAQVRIDGIALPRGSALDAYPLPAGTWSVSLLSPRGRRDTQTVEVRPGQTTFVVSKVR